MIYLAWWIFLFGVYPLAEPPHHGTSALTILDFVLHFVAGVIVVRHAFAYGEANR